MKPFLLATVLLLLVWPVTPAGRAVACSVGEDFNPVAEADILVTGTVAH
jgi:hypothetical protein